MATFHTVWSIDLGKASLKAVKLRREVNNIEILAVDKIDYPVGPNGVDAVQAAKEALNAFKIRNDVREPVVVAHPGQGTFSRFIKVPAFDAKKLKEMVGYEASQQIPFPLDEVIWDYHVVNREYLTGEEREVGIFAVRKEAIDDYLLDFTSEGLSVEVLSIGYLGLLNYVFFDIAPKEPSIILDIGATHTDLILVDGKKFWIRALPHSGNDVNKAIMERFKLSFQEAEKLKIEAGKVPQQAVKIFSTVIQPKLKELVGEIHRSSGYYRSQAGEVKFQNLYLLGGGSKVVGIKKYLSEQLGLQVHRVQTIQHFRVSRSVDLKLLQNELPTFATAFGGSLQGVGAGSCKVDLIPQEERIQKDLRRKRKHAFIGMGIVYAAIILAGVNLNGKIQTADGHRSENDTWLKNNITKYDPTAGKRTASARSEKDKKKGKDQDKDKDKDKKSGPSSASAKKAKDILSIHSDYQAKVADLDKAAELRGAALEILRALGAVLPAEDGTPIQELASLTEQEKKKAAALVRPKVEELNWKRIWIPWLRIERVEWPEQESGAGSSAERKKLPTVPAYKARAFAAVKALTTSEESQTTIRKLFVYPLEKKLKESPQLTIDPKVEESTTFSEEMIQLYYKPAGEKRTDSGESKVRGREKTVEDPQEAGKFFGYEITWYFRLKEPPEPPTEQKESGK